jgi:hypothetical protein
MTRGEVAEESNILFNAKHAPSTRDADADAA